MKNSLLNITILGLGLIALPSMASAQHYVPPAQYGGPNVIVNMDVLNPVATPAPVPLRAQRSGLRSPAEARAGVPLRLRRPAAAPTVSAAPTPYPSFPQATAPVRLKEPAPRAVASTPLAPLTPPKDPTVTQTNVVPEFAKEKPALIATPKAPEPTFSAKELVKAAEKETMPIAPAKLTTPPSEIAKAKMAEPKAPAPVAVDLPTPREIVDITPTAAPLNDVKTRQRELLAKAREEVLYDTADAAKESGVAATRVVEETKETMVETAEKTVAEIKDIAPSAAPTALKPQMAAPTPPPAVANIPAVPVVNEVAPITEEVEVAALTTQPISAPKPTAPVSGQQNSLRLTFGSGAADLTAQDTAELDQVAARLLNSNTKIQLRAFADGTPETSSKARRLSLTRALTVRSYLLDKGVKATSMDVRALGMDKSADAPADRVDIVFVR